MPPTPRGWDDINFAQYLKEREAFRDELEAMGFGSIVTLYKTGEPKPVPNRGYPLPPFSKMQTWCMQNCIGRFVVAPDFVSHVPIRGNDRKPRNRRFGVVAFENKSDAMHFKLRFHNVDYE